MGEGSFFQGVKWLGLEADHSSPYDAKVKNIVKPYHHFPIFLHSVVLN
jgi:hypothetical protein